MWKCNRLFTADWVTKRSVIGFSAFFLLSNEICSRFLSCFNRSVRELFLFLPWFKYSNESMFFLFLSCLNVYGKFLLLPPSNLQWVFLFIIFALNVQWEIFVFPSCKRSVRAVSVSSLFQMSKEIFSLFLLSFRCSVRAFFQFAFLQMFSEFFVFISCSKLLRRVIFLFLLYFEIF